MVSIMQAAITRRPDKPVVHFDHTVACCFVSKSFVLTECFKKRLGTVYSIDEVEMIIACLHINLRNNMPEDKSNKNPA